MKITTESDELGKTTTVVQLEATDERVRVQASFGIVSFTYDDGVDTNYVLVKHQ